MSLRKPLLLVLVLIGTVAGAAFAEHGSHGGSERSSSERTASREMRDRLRSERAIRERKTRGGEARTAPSASAADSKTRRVESSSSGPDAGAAVFSESSGSNISGSNLSGSDNSGPAIAEGSNSGSDSSGSGHSDSSGPGSGGSEDRSGRSGSDDDIAARMLSGSGTPIAVERDARGRERRAGEVLVVSETSPAAQVRAAGYEVIEERALAAFGEVLVRVRIPAGQDAETTLTALRLLLPEATAAVNHIFRPSNSGTVHATTIAVSPQATSTARIGIIDTGAFEQSPALLGLLEQAAAFAGSPYTPREHGTVVCEIAAAQGARLAVADVFGVDANARLIASADAIVSALNWLVTNATPVINISIAGPDNPILEHDIARTVAAGALIVAAAGNDGPAAGPVYPAAYSGVIAVTAVDEHGQVYRRANRGDYVMFAARGVHVPVQGNSQPFEVSGTSFAAPVVAAKLAHLKTLKPNAPSTMLIEDLKHTVTDLGARGRDPVFGWGRIGEVELR